VPIRAVFITKLLQAILPNFGLICAFVLPLLFGLGAAEGYSFLYYPLVLIVLAALALAAAGLASLMVMLIVRVFPARRVAEVLGFVGAIVAFVCSQSGQLVRFGQFSQNQADQAILMATRFNTPWSPLSWAGRGLVAVGERQWLSAGGLLVLSLGLAFLIFGIALTTSEHLYYTGWASIQNNRRKKKVARVARPTVVRPAGRLTRRLIPPAVSGIMVKDYYVLRRDLRNLSQLVTPLIFGIIYAVLFLRGGGQPPLGRGEAPAAFNTIVTNMFVYINVGISLFVGWMLLSRLGGMGFSQEGKNYWMLKAAPVSVAQLITAKFLVAFLPSLVLGWVFLLVITLVQRANLSMLLFTLPVVALCIAGNAGINLGFGIFGANMNWEDPRQMQRGAVGCVGALVSVIYMGVSLALFFGPAVILSLFKVPASVGQATGLLLGGIFCLACAVVPLWLASKRVPLLGESS
jgi:ABC-2 type transport system permease protein